MRTSRPLMPAAMLAGALALAGCGGSDNKPGPDPTPPETVVQCHDGSSASSVAACPKPTDVPLTGDELADAKALKKALMAFGDTRSSSSVDLAADEIASAPGKRGTPSDMDPKWEDSTTAPAVGGGWTAKGYQRETDDGEENIVSYTSGEPFMDQPLMTWVSGQSGRVTLSDDTLMITATSHEADLFPSGFRGAKLDNDGELEGTFAGLEGTFECSSSCGRSIATDGKIQLAGTWTFEPDGKIARLKVPAKYSKAPNPKFMTFGYWWSEEEGDDGPEFTVDAFADGEVKSAQSATLPGGGADGVISASYSGKASGAYVREVLDGSENVPAAAGLFTADVTLNAVFAGGDNNTVQGSIHDFMDGSTPISDWKLTLKGDAIPANANGEFNGTAGTDGTYQGQFYGGNSTDKAPVGAAGVFDSGKTFDNGRAAGAFGAGLDE